MQERSRPLRSVSAALPEALLPTTLPNTDTEDPQFAGRPQRPQQTALGCPPQTATLAGERRRDCTLSPRPTRPRTAARERRESVRSTTGCAASSHLSWPFSGRPHESSKPSCTFHRFRSTILYSDFIQRPRLPHRTRGAAESVKLRNCAKRHMRSKGMAASTKLAVLPWASSCANMATMTLSRTLTSCTLPAVTAVRKLAPALCTWAL